MIKTKSKKQVSYLLSKGSPLSGGAKAKLQSELHTGQIVVKTKPAKKPERFSQAKFNKIQGQYYKI